jgi:hypothetical protein
MTKLRRDYAIEKNMNFNIFTSLSDYYYRENMHSDILKLLFDPYTEKIGNVKYMEVFKNFIEKRLNKKIDLNIHKVKIKREKYRIDLLIYDEKKNCIFIENKINYAPDREDQIGRYYERLLRNKYKINAVVYLTLSPLKKLDKAYSIKNPGLRKEIEKILLEIPVINKIHESSFVNDVINRCIEKSNNTVSTVYLTEYASLLEYLGGNFMASDLNVQAMYKIFEDKNTLNSFKIFGNLWDNRDDIIGNVFKEYFQKELQFSIHSGDDESVYKSVKTDANIGFYHIKSNFNFNFGFVHTPDSLQIDSKNREIFKELLKDERLKKYFKDEKVEDTDLWVCKRIDDNKISCLGDLKELVETLETIIKEKF